MESALLSHVRVLIFCAMSRLPWKYTNATKTILFWYLTLLLWSSIGYTENVPRSKTETSTILIRDLLASGLGSVYFDLRTSNYTHLIELPTLKSLYVVANGNILLRLSSDNLRYLASFQLPSQTAPSLCSGNPEVPCAEESAFNLMSKTLDGQNLWYCYVYQTQYMKNAIIPNVDAARCEIPEPRTLEPNSRLVQWENSVYSSLDLNKPGVHLMADDGFLYTAGWFHGALHIHRVLLPNFNGLPNWDHFLVTPVRENYIKEPASFIMAFETKEEVYFVIREVDSVSCSSRVLGRQSHKPKEPSGSDNSGAKPDENLSTVTRLIRICKGDRGGYPYVNEGEFATFAKATLECTSQDAEHDGSQEQLSFTYGVAATWDPVGKHLYVSFSTPRGFPTAAALCIYSEEEIEKAFRSDLYSLRSDNGKPEIIANTFPNICSRFSSKTLTDRELEQGRSLSRNHVLRKQPVQPVNGRPILTYPSLKESTRGAPSTDITWNHIAVDRIGSIVVLYLAKLRSVERYLLVNFKTKRVLKACYMDQFLLETDESLEEISSLGQQFTSGQIYLLTTKHVLRVPVTAYGCQMYQSSLTCSVVQNPYCQWNQRTGTCEPRRLTEQMKSTDRAYDGLAFEIYERCSDRSSELPSSAKSISWWDSVTQRMDSKRVAESKTPVSLPCPHIQSTTVDTTEQNMTCWSQPCMNCNASGEFRMALSNCTIPPSWSPWSPWSSCQTPCGSGIQSRTRSCDSPSPIEIVHPDKTTTLMTCESEVKKGFGAENNNKLPSTQMELKHCSVHPICSESASINNNVPVEMISDVPYFWSDWGPCSTDCGLGVRTRSRLCHFPGATDSITSGQGCVAVGPSATESELCVNTSCPVEAVHTQWTEWLEPLMSPNHDGLQLSIESNRHQRVRFSCSVMNTSGLDLHIGRVQYMERRCGAWDGPCTPISENNDLTSLASQDSALAVVGHWSNWGSWSPCNQGCVPPVGVLAPVPGTLDKTHYSVPLYLHGNVQSRQRSCLFAEVSNCPGGLASATESRSCPPVPACHTDWSCWSTWSPCTGPGKNSPALGQCSWQMDGWHKRVRQCVIGQTDWLNNQVASCAGATEETGECPYIIGNEVECINSQNAVWSSWSSWTSCESGHALTGFEAKEYIADEAQDLHDPTYFRSRTRLCLSPPAVAGILPEPVSLGSCFGSWKQQQTCAPGALQLAAAMPNRQHNEDGLNGVQLFLAGLISLLLAAVITGLCLLIHHRVGSKRKDNKHITPRRDYYYKENTDVNNLNEQTNTHISTPNLYGISTNFVANESPDLPFTGPPKPILSLPPIVKTDMLATRLKRPQAKRVHGNTVIYDSVASQDLPTFFNYPDGTYLTTSYAETPLEQAVAYQEAQLKIGNRSYWSLPKTKKGKPPLAQSKSERRGETQDLSSSQHRISQENGTENWPNGGSSAYGRASPIREEPNDGNSSDYPYAEYHTRQASYVHPDYDNNSESPVLQNCTNGVDSVSQRNELSHLSNSPSKSPSNLHYEVNNRLSTSSISAHNAERNRTSRPPSELPPEMPLLSIRYADGASNRRQNHLSNGSSIDWNIGNGSTRSELYSLCLERPSNPHLREASGHSSSPSDRELSINHRQ